MINECFKLTYLNTLDTMCVYNFNGICRLYDAVIEYMHLPGGW